MSSFIYPNYLIGGSGEKGPTGQTGPIGPIGPTGQPGGNIYGTTGAGAISIQGVCGNYQGYRFITSFSDGRTFISSNNFIGLTGFWFVRVEATCSGCPLNILTPQNGGTFNFSFFKFSENRDYNPLSTKQYVINLKTLKTRTPDLIRIEPTEDLNNIKISYNNLFSGLTLMGATYPSLVIGSGITIFGATGSFWNSSENKLDIVTRQYLEGITHIVGNTSDNIDSFYNINTENNSIFQIIRSSLNSMKIEIQKDNTIQPDESKSMMLIIPLETAFTGPFEIDGSSIEVYFPLGIIPKPEIGINIYSAISYGKDWYMNCVGLGITKDYWSKQKLQLNNIYLPSESLLTNLLAAWGNTQYDLNNDGIVNASDLTLALSSWAGGIFGSHYPNCVNNSGISYGRECIGQDPISTNPPTLQSIDPDSGNADGGTSVIITGTEFSGVQSLKIGNTPFNIYNVLSSTTIQATTPPGTGTSGAYPITITTSNGSATGLQYTYIVTPPSDPVPQITSVSPSDGHRLGGEYVTISGSNLDRITAISIQGIDATIQNQSQASITVITPSGYPGAAQFRIHHNNGQSFVRDGWQYRQPVVPNITNIDPDRGPAAGGIPIIINGFNLIDIVSVRMENSGYECNWNEVNETQIEAIIPAGDGGETNLIVETRQEGLATSAFTYIGRPPPSPTITHITPDNGLAGIPVKISGTGLYYQSGYPQISIDENPCTITSISDTEIAITIPTNDTPGSKPLKFIAINGTLNINDAFTYNQPPPPQLTGITSSNEDGPNTSYLLTTKNVPNQTVLITGNRLSQINKVSIYEPNGEVFIINNPSTTDTSIKFQLNDTPVERNRSVGIVAETASGITSNQLTNVQWKVKPYLEKILLKSNPSQTAPHPISLQATTQPVVLVYGKYLDAKNSGSGVDYSYVDNLECNQGWNEWNGTYYEVQLPSINISGSKPFKRKRSLDGSEIQLNNQFIYYNAAPVVTEIVPSSGRNNVSTPITISGSNLFFPGETTRVYVNNTEMALTHKHETVLEFILPPSPSTIGPVAIKIERTGGPWPTNGGRQETLIFPGFTFDYPTGPICSEILNHQVPVSAQGTVVNFVTGTVQNGVASGVPGWDINPYGTSGTSVALLAGAGTGIMRNPDAGTNTFRTNLAVGTVVGPTAYFYGNSAAAIGTAAGQWTPNSEGYIGVKFINESTNSTHYGWIHLRIGADATDRTIVRYCWNPIPNEPITTPLL